MALMHVYWLLMLTISWVSQYFNLLQRNLRHLQQASNSVLSRAPSLQARLQQFRTLQPWIWITNIGAAVL